MARAGFSGPQLPLAYNDALSRLKQKQTCPSIFPVASAA